MHTAYAVTSRPAFAVDALLEVLEDRRLRELRQLAHVGEAPVLLWHLREERRRVAKSPNREVAKRKSTFISGSTSYLR